MKVSNLRSIAAIAVLSASSILLSACGTQNQLYGGQYGYQGNTTGTQTSYNSGSTAQQRCASMPNVRGQGYSATSDREYRVCKGSTLGTAASQIAIFPEDRMSKQICVFPVQLVYGQQSAVVVNQYAAPSSRFAVQCGGINGSGSMMDFGNLSFQGAYIVNYNDASAFASCLASNTVTNCAANYNIGYSVGFWQ